MNLKALIYVFALRNVELQNAISFGMTENSFNLGSGTSKTL